MLVIDVKAVLSLEMTLSSLSRVGGTHVSMHCLNASGNAVSVICHSRRRDSHVSIRKSAKRCSRRLSASSSGLNSNVGLVRLTRVRTTRGWSGLLSNL